MNAFSMWTFLQSLNKEIELEESLTATAWINREATQKHSPALEEPPNLWQVEIFLTCANLLICNVSVGHNTADMQAQHANANRLQCGRLTGTWHEGQIIADTLTSFHVA